MPDQSKVHTVIVYRDGQVGRSFEADSFKVNDGLLTLWRDNLLLATYAPGKWDSFTDETQIELFNQADMEDRHA